MLALPIFPGRRQPSIVGRNELNYRVRNGNGWTLVLISTNYVDTNFASLASGSTESSQRSVASPLQIESASLGFDLIHSLGKTQ